MFIRTTIPNTGRLLRELNYYRFYESVRCTPPCPTVLIVGALCQQRDLFFSAGIVVIDRAEDGTWRLGPGGLHGSDALVVLAI